MILLLGALGACIARDATVAMYVHTFSQATEFSSLYTLGYLAGKR